MKVITNSKELGVILLCLIVTFLVLTVCAKAYFDKTTPTAADLWTIDTQYDQSLALYTYLRENGWIKDSVTHQEFDYYYVLLQQVTKDTRIPLEIAIAQVAQESRFDKDAKNNSAVGLFQVIPIFTERYLHPYFEEGHLYTTEDFLDPRNNIIVGVSYMDYILSEVDDNMPYALMWYNQGAISASDLYQREGAISTYASSVLFLSNNIKPYLEGGENYE